MNTNNTTEKTELNNQYREICKKIDTTKQAKQSDIETAIAEKVKPLIEEANKIRQQIEHEAANKYEAQFNEMFETKKELKDKIDAIKIVEANDVWYPENTIVFLWEWAGSSWSSNRKQAKTDKTGIVKIYDGIIPIAEKSRYNKPDKGDIIVLHHKKDGTVGLKFDVISYGERLRNYFPTWLAENDTPDNNPVTRKPQKEESEYKF